jgi:hypothetical protein
MARLMEAQSQRDEEGGRREARRVGKATLKRALDDRRGGELRHEPRMVTRRAIAAISPRA